MLYTDKLKKIKKLADSDNPPKVFWLRDYVKSRSCQLSDPCSLAYRYKAWFERFVSTIDSHAWGKQSHSSRVLLSGPGTSDISQVAWPSGRLRPPLQQIKCEKGEKRMKKKEEREIIIINEHTNNVRERYIYIYTLFVVYKCTTHWASQQLTFDDNTCINIVHYCCSCLVVERAT